MHKIIINKSTVPVGSTKLTEDIINEHLKEEKYKFRNCNEIFTVISMPEFLAEG